jgi:hypothetical protein
MLFFYISMHIYPYLLIKRFKFFYTGWSNWMELWPWFLSIKWMAPLCNLTFDSFTLHFPFIFSSLYPFFSVSPLLSFSYHIFPANMFQYICPCSNHNEVTNCLLQEVWCQALLSLTFINKKKPFRKSPVKIKSINKPILSEHHGQSSFRISNPDIVG